MKAQKTISLSETEKLEQLLDVYSKVLHPDFFNVFRKQINDTYEENKRRAYEDAKISDDALAIERLLLGLKRKGETYSDHPNIVSFHLKYGYKDFLKLYGLIKK